MVLDPIPQSLPVHFFGSRPQPPTSPLYIPEWIRVSDLTLPHIMERDLKVKSETLIWLYIFGMWALKLSSDSIHLKLSSHSNSLSSDSIPLKLSSDSMHFPWNSHLTPYPLYTLYIHSITHCNRLQHTATHCNRHSSDSIPSLHSIHAFDHCAHLQPLHQRAEETFS